MLYPRRYSAAIVTTAGSLVKNAVSVSGRNCEYRQTDRPKIRANPIPESRHLFIPNEIPKKIRNLLPLLGCSYLREYAGTECTTENFGEIIKKIPNHLNSRITDPELE